MSDPIFNITGPVGEAISYRYTPSYQRLINQASVIMEVIGQPRPDSRHGQVIGEVLSRAPMFKSAGVIGEALGGNSGTILPLFVDTIRAAATQQDRSWLSLADTISPESVSRLWTFSASELPIDFPTSYTRISASVTLAVLALPVVTISPESVAAFWSFTTQKAETGAYPLVDQVRSDVFSAGEVVLVAQSIDIPYVPSSGVFLPSNLVLVAQACPLPMYQTPIDIPSLWVKAAQKRPVEKLPRSYTRVGQTLSQAVTHIDASMPRSNIDARQVVTQAVTPAPADENVVGRINAASVVASVVASSVLENPVGPEHVKSITAYHVSQDDTMRVLPSSEARIAEYLVCAVQASDMAAPRSPLYGKTVISLAVSSVEYRPPAAMLAAMLAAGESSLVAQGSSYPDPGVAVSPADFAGLALSSVIPAHYDSPNDVLAGSKSEKTASIFETAVQANPNPLPWSQTRLSGFHELVVASLPLKTPEEIAESGIKAGMVVEHLAFRAAYPDPNIPTSSVSVSSILENLATTASYPDAYLPTSEISVGLVENHVSFRVQYEDPAGLFKPISVISVCQPVATFAQYPDWSSLGSPVVAQQVAQQVAQRGTFPNKDLPQSVLSTAQVLSSVASKINYPDKDAPQSKAVGVQVVEHVAIKDRNMYKLPEPPRRQRVVISCRFVY